MKIIIAGYGFVGKAILNAIGKDHELIVIDPKYTTLEIRHHLDMDGIIICVDTPTGENGIIAENVASVLDQVPVSMPVLIKSTVTPTVVDAFREIYPDCCVGATVGFFVGDIVVFLAVGVGAAVGFIGTSPNFCINLLSTPKSTLPSPVEPSQPAAAANPCSQHISP
jgi:UDP-glucose 6-dehydrogenase